MNLLVNIIYYFFNLYKIFKKTYYLMLYYLVKNNIYYIYVINGTTEIHSKFDNRDHYDIAFIKQVVYNKDNYKEYYKRILNNYKITTNDLCKLKTKNNIISIYVKINSNEYFINSDNFTLVGNIILDKPFLKWYLYKNHNIKNIDDNYTITLFDKDVNVYELSSKNYVLIEEDSFKIKTI